MKTLITTVALFGLAGHGLCAESQTTTPAKPAARPERCGTIVVPCAGNGMPTLQVAVNGGRPSDADGERGKISYLGLAGTPVSPDLAHHLGLPKGLYLSVVALQADSPADKAGLQEHDILTHLDDQVLINQPQLQQLVRMKKAGDAVTLKVLRAGKELSLKATLGERDAPVEAPVEVQPFPGGGFGFHQDPFWGNNPNDIQEQIRRMQEKMQRNMQRHGAGALPDDEDDPAVQGNVQTFSSSSKSVSMTTEKGKFTFDEKDGKKRFKAESPDGKVLFDGPVNSDDERSKVPADLEETLQQMESGNMGGVQLRIGPGKKNRPTPKGQAI